jgi:transcriptional regulator with XRE-family HTH domain
MDQDRPENPLAAYLRVNGLSQREFAGLLGLIRGYPVSQVTVSRWCNACPPPGGSSRALIMQATRGEVRPEHWGTYLELTKARAA